MCKKIIAILIVFVMLYISISAASFSDMPKSDYWSYDALKSAVDDGLLNGSDGKIYPKNNLTRAEMATILVRAYELTKEADISEYTDVKKDMWYYSYMQKACAAGLFKGDDTKKLRPENNITRQEVFVVLARALNLSSGKSSVLDDFTDMEKIATWAKDATASMIESGYIKGSDGKINPENNITREEFAQIMYNLKKAGALDKKADEKADNEKNEDKSDGKTEDKETSQGDSDSESSKPSGGSSKPSGGSSKPSGGSSKPSEDKDDDNKPSTNIPSFGIDENVDMSDD